MYLRNYPTLAVGIYQMSSDITTGANSYDYPALFAIMTISELLPVVRFFQKPFDDICRVGEDRRSGAT